MLLVDDVKDICESLKDYLVVSGHEVDIAMTAREALRLTSLAHYDAIILDIALPDLDGYALARRIREHYAFRARPIMLAVSGSEFDDTHPYAADAAFDLFLVKPANPEHIKAALVR